MPQPKRVLVVGAGAAGMACADTLAQHPDRFKVTLVEADNRCGGQAFSIPVDEKKFGASWLNQGVQGGSHIFHHTNRMFKAHGVEASPVDLQVSFGQNEHFWTNVWPTPLLEKHAKEIKRFMGVLTVIHRLEPLFVLVSIKKAMKLFWFSDDFTNYLILPCIALFLGTGNATPDVSCVIMERLFKDQTCGMWYPGDPTSLVSNFPPMIVFPEFAKFYKTWENDLRSKGVDIRLSTQVTRVISRSKKGVTVGIKAAGASDEEEKVEEYDELVLCTLADTSLRLLSKTARWVDKKVLGSAKFSDDVTVTHSDADYMRKRYVNTFESSLAVTSINGADHSERVDRAKKKGFKPMYYIVNQRADGKDPQKLDMSFDCSNYQNQFPSDLPLDRHVFQTIFLNKKDEQHWTKSQINPDKVIAENWWHQLCHNVSHYFFVVPWLYLLNGHLSTTFAGSWTLVNAHEVAIISGMAAAFSLGAAYPEDLEEDSFAVACFKYYMLLAHHKLYRKGKNKA